MTINLNANVTFPNVNRWRVLAFDLGSGRVTLRFTAPGDAQWLDVDCFLSDVAGQSTGAIINPSPRSWNDKIVPYGPQPSNAFVGMGAANALTNAQSAYRSTGNHNAGLRAVEGVAMTDGWVSAALAGT